MEALITLPTMEFVGALNDVIPFASTEADDPGYNVVRLESRREDVYVLASNRNQHVRYELDPNSVEVHDPTPFSIRVSLDDAKHMARTYKLATKLSWAPIDLGVEVLSMSDNLYRLRVLRDAGESWTKLGMNVTGRGAPRPGVDGDPVEPDIHFEINKWISFGLIGVIFGIAYLYARRKGPVEESHADDEAEALLRE